MPAVSATLWKNDCEKPKWHWVHYNPALPRIIGPLDAGTNELATSDAYVRDELEQGCADQQASYRRHGTENRLAIYEGDIGRSPSATSVLNQESPT